MNDITIEPFVASVHDIFDSMVGRPVKVEESQATMSEPHPPDFIGVIGLSGSAQGMVALRFPEETALAIIGQMVGAKFDSIDPAIIDGVGELVNMVAGSAKGRMQGHSISISLPTVVRGDLCRRSNMQEAMWTELRLTSDLGTFWLIVSLKAAQAKTQEVVRESACR